MINLLILFQNPGNGGGHPACATPNPPWWCTDSPEPEPAPVDIWLPFSIVVMVVWILTILSERPKRKYNDNKDSKVQPKETSGGSNPSRI